MFKNRKKGTTEETTKPTSKERKKQRTQEQKEEESRKDGNQNQQKQPQDIQEHPQHQIEPLLFDIGLPTTEREEAEQAQPKKGKSLIKKITIFGGMTLVAVAAFLLLNQEPKDTAKTPEVPSGEVTPDSEKDPTDKDSDVVYGDDVPDDWGIDEPKEDENKPQETPKDGEYVIPEGYVPYENGYINLTMANPEDWYVTEKTQDGFEIIKENAIDGVFKLEGIKLTQELPVADFTSEDSDIPTILKTTLQPTTNTAVASNKPIISNTLTTAAKIVGTPKTEKKTIGTYSVNLVSFKVQEFEKYYDHVQAVFKLGGNLMFFHLTMEGEEPEQDKKTNQPAKELTKEPSNQPKQAEDSAQNTDKQPSNSEDQTQIEEPVEELTALQEKHKETLIILEEMIKSVAIK